MNLRRAVLAAVPTSVKQSIKNFIHHQKLRSVVPEVQAGPSADAVARLREAWGNTGYSADIDFLMQSTRLARSTTGNILECGSGVSTFLLACLKIPVYTLEHDREWAEFCAASIRSCNLNANVIHSPLISYGAHDWYRLPTDLPPISLVLCDGPPGTTRGGRGGLIPAVQHLLTPDCTILMDDVDRPEEHALAEKWHAECGMDVEYIRGTTRMVAVLKKPAAR